MSDDTPTPRRDIMSRDEGRTLHRPSPLIRRGLDSLEQRRTRTLHFPTEHSVGKLAPGQEGSPWWPSNEIFGEARCDVFFAGNAPLFLTVSDEVDDLSFLADLRPDDIQHLEFGYKPNFGFKQISDDDLRHVAHLTGLLTITGFDAPRLTSAGVAQLRNLKQLRDFGPIYFPMDDDCLRELGNLTGLERLTADGHLTDVGIGHIRGLGRLRTLTISSSWHAITESGLGFIDELPDLERLGIFHAAVTDLFIERVIRLPKLKALTLDSTAITDEGLDLLHQATNFESICLETTAASASAVEALRAALPDCRVVINPGA